MYYNSTNAHIIVKLAQASPCISSLTVNFGDLEGLFDNDFMW